MSSIIISETMLLRKIANHLKIVEEKGESLGKSLLR